eukprot:scaffold48221_cov51-Phaeocystis_antarctica.AAC.2
MAPGRPRPRHRDLGTFGGASRRPLLACSGTRAPRTRQPRPPPAGTRAPQQSRPRPPSRRRGDLPSRRPKAAPPPPPRRPQRPPQSVAGRCTTLSIRLVHHAIRPAQALERALAAITLPPRRRGRHLARLQCRRQASPRGRPSCRSSRPARSAPCTTSGDQSPSSSRAPSAWARREAPCRPPRPPRPPQPPTPCPTASPRAAHALALAPAPARSPWRDPPCPPPAAGAPAAPPPCEPPLASLSSAACADRAPRRAEAQSPCARPSSTNSAAARGSPLRRASRASPPCTPHAPWRQRRHRAGRCQLQWTSWSQSHRAAAGLPQVQSRTRRLGPVPSARPCRACPCHSPSECSCGQTPWPIQTSQDRQAPPSQVASEPVAWAPAAWAPAAWAPAAWAPAAWAPAAWALPPSGRAALAACARGAEPRSLPSCRHRWKRWRSCRSPWRAAWPWPCQLPASSSLLLPPMACRATPWAWTLSRCCGARDRRAQSHQSQRGPSPPQGPRASSPRKPAASSPPRPGASSTPKPGASSAPRLGTSSEAGGRCPTTCCSTRPSGPPARRWGPSPGWQGSCERAGGWPSPRRAGTIFGRACPCAPRPCSSQSRASPSSCPSCSPPA